jgi:hypothetical protein
MTKRYAVGRSILWIAAGACVVVSAATAPAAAESVASAPQPAPGGKNTFVVSVGGFHAGRTDNWVRLGQYAFHPASGSVTGSWWRWNQGSMLDIRVDTPVAAAGCGPTQCSVRTPRRFLARPAETVTGTYRIDGTTLTIAWPGPAPTPRERWTITPVTRTDGSADPSLVQLIWAGAAGSYTATAGYGAGSNAPFATNASMSALMRPENNVGYRYTYVGIAGGRLTSGTSVLSLPVFRQCTDGRCLGATSRTTPGAGCVHYPPGDSAQSATINYYLASFAGDRRNAYEHWFRCLAYRPDTGQKCYKLNSHVKPQLQIIDDAGRFRGWVGLETSFNTTGDGNSAGDRTRDVLAVTRAGPRLLAP